MRKKIEFFANTNTIPNNELKFFSRRKNGSSVSYLFSVIWTLLHLDVDTLLVFEIIIQSPFIFTTKFNVRVLIYSSVLCFTFLFLFPFFLPILVGTIFVVFDIDLTFREEHTTYQPTVLFKRTKHHKGSIYCMAWSPQGDLVATGSNDKTVKLMRYNEVQKQLEGKEIELTMHDGTVRDLCFLEDSTNKTSLLISGGAGDCKIYVTDCATSTPFQALSGHGGHILTLYNWGGAMFVSGSQVGLLVGSSCFFCFKYLIGLINCIVHVQCLSLLFLFIRIKLYVFGIYERVAVWTRWHQPQCPVHVKDHRLQLFALIHPDGYWYRVMRTVHVFYMIFAEIDQSSASNRIHRTSGMNVHYAVSNAQ